MRVQFNEASGEAIFGHVKPDGDRASSAPSAVVIVTDVKSDIDDDGDWFARAARGLYPTKPGTALFYATQLGNERFGDERLCQKYAAGTVRPQAYFLRRLLRSKHGKQWLNAVMAGCTEDWWLAHQDDRRDAEALRAFERSRLKKEGGK